MKPLKFDRVLRNYFRKAWFTVILNLLNFNKRELPGRIEIFLSLLLYVKIPYSNRKFRLTNQNGDAEATNEPKEPNNTKRCAISANVADDCVMIQQVNTSLAEFYVQTLQVVEFRKLDHMFIIVNISPRELPSSKCLWPLHFLSIKLALMSTFEMTMSFWRVIIWQIKIY